MPSTSAIWLRKPPELRTEEMPSFWPFNAYLKIDEARFITAFAIALLLQLSVDAEARADDPHLGIID